MRCNKRPTCDMAPLTNHQPPPTTSYPWPKLDHNTMMNHHPPPPIYLWPKQCVRNTSFGPMVCFFNLIFLFFIAEPSHLSSTMRHDDQLDMTQHDNDPHGTPLTIHHPPPPTSCSWHNDEPPSTTSNISMAQMMHQKHIVWAYGMFF